MASARDHGAELAARLRVTRGMQAASWAMGLAARAYGTRGMPELRSRVASAGEGQKAHPRPRLGGADITADPAAHVAHQGADENQTQFPGGMTARRAGTGRESPLSDTNRMTSDARGDRAASVEPSRRIKVTVLEGQRGSAPANSTPDTGGARPDMGTGQASTSPSGSSKPRDGASKVAPAAGNWPGGTFVDSSRSPPPGWMVAGADRPATAIMRSLASTGSAHGATPPWASPRAHDEGTAPQGLSAAPPAVSPGQSSTLIQSVGTRPASEPAAGYNQGRGPTMTGAQDNSATTPHAETDGGSDSARPLEGDVYLDGALVGRWMARTLATQAGRPSSGGSGFDPRRSAFPTGAMIGG